MSLFMAAALPLIWWTGAPDTQVREAAPAEFCVDPRALAEWRKVTPSVNACATDGQRLLIPGIDTKVAVASATRSPWINANAWRFRRDPAASYLYVDAARKSALALAEAFAYGVRAAVQTGSEDMPRAAAMLRFLKSVADPGSSPLADVVFVDDGSAQAGEAMNLLARRNILFRRVSTAAKVEGKVVRIGSAEFPKSLTANPADFAYAVRRWIGDSRRLLRIYGSENVLAHVTTTPGGVRVHLLNYTANAVEGVRVRVRGRFTGVSLRVFDAPDATPDEVTHPDDATEFTIREMNEYAVCDLKR
jgi:hypothetical protein